MDGIRRTDLSGLAGLAARESAREPVKRASAPDGYEPGHQIDVPEGLQKHVDEIVVKPWLALRPELEALGERKTDADKSAFATLKKAERKGLWGEGEGAAVQDLALLKLWLPPHAGVEDGAQCYAGLIDTELREHTDPSPHARRALQVMAPTLREGESAADAARCYDKLFRFEKKRDINASEHAREDWVVVDAGLLAGQSRLQATENFIADPDRFSERQADERKRIEARDAEVKRVADAVATPRQAGTIERQDEWIIVGDVRVPRNR